MAPLESKSPPVPSSFRVRWLDWFVELPPALKRFVVAALLVLIVVLPAVISGIAERNSYEADLWITHTYEVAAKLNKLLFDLRDSEAALRTVLLVSEPKAETRFHDSAALLPDDLHALQDLTLDNPRQQERLGRLRAAAEGRIAAMDEMLQLHQTGKQGEALSLLKDTFLTHPFRDVADEMNTEESGLLADRTREAREKKTLAVSLLFGAVLAQILFFGILYGVSERDVRRRHEAEELSARSAAHALSLVEATPDPLAVIDESLRVRTLNKAFCSFYGIEAAQALEQPLREAGAGAWDAPDLLQRLADLIPREREIWDQEVPQKIGGEERVVLLTAKPFPSATGRRLILIAVKDVTGRKRSEEQIVRLNRELARRVEQTQAVNQELEAFSYSVSHDLRAPLRHITGFSDMLNSHLASSDDPKTQRYLKYIRESANQMGTLIDDLLVFSRMGRAEMLGEEVDMNTLVRETVKHFGLETEGRRIEFDIAALPSAHGDASMLRLVWMNLIGNAIKYTRQREEARIEIGSKPSEGSERVYYIRDNGVGFNMKYAHKLFGVFQRLHQADEYEGTGIGLANVRRIVQRHGGKAWAQGHIDQGATFFFSLPLETDPKEGPEPSPKPTPNRAAA